MAEASRGGQAGRGGQGDRGGRGGGRRRPLVEAFAASAGMVLFALFAHRGLPWLVAGAAGLLSAAAAIAGSFPSARDLLRLVGLARFSRRAGLATAAGCAAGVGLGALYRGHVGMPLLPQLLAPFASVACLVGAAEELVYRGWVQGQLRALGAPAAVLIAALAHACYKTALFALPPAPLAIDLGFIAVWTIAGGALFGLLRELSASAVPAIAAHAAFDLLVYGAATRAPWWVWA